MPIKLKVPSWILHSDGIPFKIQMMHTKALYFIIVGIREGSENGQRGQNMVIF